MRAPTPLEGVKLGQVPVYSVSRRRLSGTAGAFVSTNPIDEPITLGLFVIVRTSERFYRPEPTRRLPQPLRVGPGSFDCQWLVVGRFSNMLFRRHSSTVRAVCVNAPVRICAGGDQGWAS